MHADELVKEKTNDPFPNDGSEGTIAPTENNHAAFAPTPTFAMGTGMGTVTPPRTGTAGSSGAAPPPAKSAIKNSPGGSGGGGPLRANGTERSARSNMYYNQTMNQGVPREDEFYDKV